MEKIKLQIELENIILEQKKADIKLIELQRLKEAEFKDKQIGKAKTVYIILINQNEINLHRMKSIGPNTEKSSPVSYLAYFSYLLSFSSLFPGQTHQTISTECTLNLCTASQQACSRTPLSPCANCSKKRTETELKKNN